MNLVSLLKNECFASRDACTPLLVKKMETTEKTRSFLKRPIAIALAVALTKLIIFIFVGNQYGYFRDELYFLESTNHLALGYPDHAPLSIWIAKFSKSIFGESLYAIRFFSALSGALKILLTGFLVKEFGGKHFAVLLACLCVLVAPVYLTIDNFLGMNTFEPISWMGCVLSYIWAVKRENPNYWFLFGAFAGLGLMNKHSLVFFGLAFVIGLLLTQDRKAFANKNLWFAGAIAFLLFLPNLIWQYQNDWATLELLRSVSESGKNVVLAPHEFFFQQIIIHHPLTAIVWLAGLWFLLFDKEGKRFRTLGIAYLLTLGFMIYFKAKHYYLSPIYPMLFAAGGVFWENLLSRFKFGKVFKVALPLLILITGAILAPMSLPILPVEKFGAYSRAIRLPSTKTEVSHEGPLPQIFGDMFGWEEMTEKVAEVYNSLPEEERKKAAIYANNYGQAAAIDLFGKKYSLPKSISPHQSYFLWGPRDYDGSVIIVLGGEKESTEAFCESVEEKAEVNHPYSMKYEKYNILVCRNLKEPLPKIWNSLKVWR